MKMSDIPVIRVFELNKNLFLVMFASKIKRLVEGILENNYGNSSRALI